MLLGFEKGFQAMVTQFAQICHCWIRWRMAYEFFYVLYYVQYTVFKPSKDSLIGLSTIYNINVGNWLSNPLSREAVVFCYSISLYRMLISMVDHGLYVSPHLQISSKTFAFMQTAWSFILFLLTFSTSFLYLCKKNVFCLWNKAIYYSHKLLSNVDICYSLQIHFIYLYIYIYTAMKLFLQIA